jgi:hypothetical protein
MNPARDPAFLMVLVLVICAANLSMTTAHGRAQAWSFAAQSVVMACVYTHSAHEYTA